MTATRAQGTNIKMSPTSFVAANAASAIVGVTGFTGPSPSRTIIDTTDLSSTAKTFTTGLVDNGEFAFDMNYDPEIHDDIETANAAGTMLYFVLTFSSGGKRQFQGIFQSFEPEGTMDALYTAKASIKISGAVEIVAAS